MTKPLGLIAAIGFGLALVFFAVAGMLSPGSFRGLEFGADDWRPGTPATHELAWSGGDRLNIALPSEVMVMPDGPPRVILHGDSNTLDRVTLSGGKLSGRDIGCFMPFFCTGRHNPMIQVEVHGVSLSEIAISGVSEVKLGRIEQDHLNLRISGAGSIEGDGHVGSLDLVLSGASDVNLGHLDADRVRVVLSGVGEAEIAPHDEADVTVSGMGEVNLTTKPQRLTTHISGMGEVNGPGIDEHNRHAGRHDQSANEVGRQIRQQVEQQLREERIQDRIKEKAKEKADKALKDKDI
jgi:hypothetical protein